MSLSERFVSLVKGYNGRSKVNESTMGADASVEGPKLYNIKLLVHTCTITFACENGVEESAMIVASKSKIMVAEQAILRPRQINLVFHGLSGS